LAHVYTEGLKFSLSVSHFASLHANRLQLHGEDSRVNWQKFACQPLNFSLAAKFNTVRFFPFQKNFWKNAVQPRFPFLKSFGVRDWLFSIEPA
jgi:hypothetical protein